VFRLTSVSDRIFGLIVQIRPNSGLVLTIRPNACRHLKNLCKLGLKPKFGLRTKSDLFHLIYFIKSPIALYWQTLRMRVINNWIPVRYCLSSPMFVATFVTSFKTKQHHWSRNLLSFRTDGEYLCNDANKFARRQHLQLGAGRALLCLTPLVTLSYASC